MPKIFTSSDSDLSSIKYDHSGVQNSSYTYKRGNEVKLEGTELYLSNLPTGLDFTTFFPPEGTKRAVCGAMELKGYNYFMYLWNSA